MIFVCEVTILPPRPDRLSDRVRRGPAFPLYLHAPSSPIEAAATAVRWVCHEMLTLSEMKEQHRRRCNRRRLQSYLGVAKEEIGAVIRACANNQAGAPPPEGWRPLCVNSGAKADVSSPILVKVKIPLDQSPPKWAVHPMSAFPPVSGYRADIPGGPVGAKTDLRTLATEYDHKQSGPALAWLILC